MKSRFLKEISEEIINEHVIYEGLKQLHSKKHKPEHKSSSSGFSIKYDIIQKENHNKKAAVMKVIRKIIFPDIQKVFQLCIIHSEKGLFYQQEKDLTKS